MFQCENTVQGREAPKNSLWLPVCFGSTHQIAAYALIDTELSVILAEAGPWFLSDRHGRRPPKKHFYFVTSSGIPWQSAVGLNRVVMLLNFTITDQRQDVLSDPDKLFNGLRQFPRVRTVNGLGLDCRVQNLSCALSGRAMKNREAEGRPSLIGLGGGHSDQGYDLAELIPRVPRESSQSVAENFIPLPPPAQVDLDKIFQEATQPDTSEVLTSEQIERKLREQNQNLGLGLPPE